MIDVVRADRIKNVIIAGDLNADKNTQPQNHVAMVRLMEANSLCIHIDKPTRVTETSTSILDQFITNVPDFVKEVNVSDAPLLTNDHLTTFLTLNFKVQKERTYDRFIWLYGKADWEGFRQALMGASWEEVFEINDVDLVCRKWTDTFLNIARQFIPNKVIKVRPNDAPFYDNELRQMKRKVIRKYKAAKHSQNHDLWEAYKHCRNAYVDALRDAKEKHSLKMAADLRKNENISPKRWWHTVKAMMGQNRQSQYPPLVINDTTLSDPTLKADAFNRHFVNQTFLDEEHAQLPTEYPLFEQAKLDSISITEEEVLDQLRAVKTAKSTGPDLVSPRMLKEAALSICPSLTRLFNLSMEQGKVPKMWKEANVTPVHKKRDRSDVNNYRPVSLLSCVGKLQERVIFKHMYNYLQTNSLITPMQSGFRPGDSTVCQLIDVYHIISKALDCKKDVRLVFCDISKAFDRVWHKGLLFKLSKIGINGKLLSWFTSYLSDRRQRVSLQGHSSGWALIRAGVPQGSVLGPLLFLIYINDIVHDVQSNIRLFADDTTLYIEVVDALTATNTLNRDLTSISQWANKWLVAFSPEKTTSMLCSLRNRTEIPKLYFDNTEVSNVENHRHLGITLTQDMSWQRHIDDITARANKRLDVLCRLSYQLDRNTLATLYCSFIRPVLEYGDTLYNGCTLQQSNSIEQVQKRAARIITGCIRGTPTRLMYNELGWTTMKERRDFHCLCLFHKIINGTAPNYLVKNIPESVGIRTGRTLRNSTDLSMITSRTSVFQRSFFPSTIKLWNSLNPVVRETPNISEFKRHLRPKRAGNRSLSFGTRKLNVIWTRIRLGCSSLRGQLYRMHIVNDPTCNCGHKFEDAKHYFLECPLYNRQRIVLLNNIHKFIEHSDLDVILHGCENLAEQDNRLIIECIHSFIQDSKRFVT